MIYFEDGGDRIKKYNVGFNRTELKKIVLDLINNCGIKEHIIEERCSDPKGEPRKSKVYVTSKTNTGKTHSYGDCGSDEPVYKYDYIIIHYPRLAELIETLLEGNESALYDIVQYVVEEPKVCNVNLENYKVRINELLDSNPTAAIKLIENLNKEKEFVKLNQGLQSTQKYYEALMNSFNFVFLDSMEKRTIMEYNDFCKTESGNAEFYFPVSDKENILLLRPIKHTLS